MLFAPGKSRKTVGMSVRALVLVLDISALLY